MEAMSLDIQPELHGNFLQSLHFRQKQVVLIASLLIAILICSIFAVLNYDQGNDILVIFEAVFATIFLFLFILVLRSHRYVKSASTFFVFFTLLVCLIFYYSSETHVSVFMWSIVCCFFAQFFLESKFGSHVSIAFMAITFLLLFRRYFIDPHSVSFLVLSHIVIINLSALLFSILYENRRVSAEAALTEANLKLENMAVRDGLTGLFNRRYFDQVLKNEWMRLQRTNQPLSLILSDIDYFKKYNDSYGHLAGDECLKQVAEGIKNAVQRVSDVAARYGGEEFAVILPNTDSDGAKAIAQAIKDRILESAIPHKSSDVKKIVTMSLGIATVIPTDSSDTDDFIVQADDALYKSKENGRNRITAG